jgi:hypothetical protein
MQVEYLRKPTGILSPVYTWNGAQMREVMCSEKARAFMGAYNQAQWPKTRWRCVVSF